MFEVPKIIFSLTNEEGSLPTRNSVSDCGYILKSVNTKIISEKESVTIETGLKVEYITKGIWAMLLSLEELSQNHGIHVVTSIIENDFRNELKITLYNSSDKCYLINSGDNVAKLVYMPLLTIEPILKNE